MTHQTVGNARDGWPDACVGSIARPEPGCPVEVTLTALRGRWTPLVLREFLGRNGLSYSELSRALPGLSDKVLSERLAQLTESGVLERRRTASFPPRVRYVLTDRGRDLEPVLRALWAWGSTDRG